MSDAGGDPACWLHLVCDGCGLVRDDGDPEEPCPRCGERRSDPPSDA